MGELHGIGNGGDEVRQPDGTSFGEAQPGATEITVAPESALDHVPEQYDPYAAERANDAAAAARFAEKPHLQGGVEFVGPDMDRPSMAGFRQLWLDDLARQHAESLEGAVALDDTDSIHSALAVADRGLEAIGKLINVDIAPPVGPVRLAPDQESYITAYRKVHGPDVVPDTKPDAGGGFFNIGHGMVVERTGEDPDWEEVTAIHERIHQRSQLIVRPNIDAYIDGKARVSTMFTIGLSGGVAVNVSAPHEAATDMALARIVKGEGLSGRLGGYIGAALLLDGIITETAGKLKVTENDIELALYRAMLSSDGEGKAMVEDAIGPARAGIFMRAGSPSLRDTVLLAHMLKLPDTAAYAKQLADEAEAKGSTGISLFGWQPVKQTP